MDVKHASWFKAVIDSVGEEKTVKFVENSFVGYPISKGAAARDCDVVTPVLVGPILGCRDVVVLVWVLVFTVEAEGVAVAGVNVGLSWGSFSVVPVTVSLILNTSESSLNHLLRNENSIAAQFFFSSCGSSSNQSSASLYTPR